MASIVQSNQPSAQETSKGVKEMPVEQSSFLQHIKYDQQNFQLTVTMKNGGQYTHFYVYPSMVDEFMRSPSKGKFYADVIKGKHPANRIIDKTIGPAIKKSKKEI